MTLRGRVYDKKIRYRKRYKICSEIAFIFFLDILSCLVIFAVYMQRLECRFTTSKEGFHIDQCKKCGSLMIMPVTK